MVELVLAVIVGMVIGILVGGAIMQNVFWDRVAVLVHDQHLTWDQVERLGPRARESVLRRMR